MSLKKGMLPALALGLCGFMPLSALSIEIMEGPHTGTDVGSLDSFIAQQPGPFTMGEGSPEGEEIWVNSMLDPDASFTTKATNVSLWATDTTDVYAFLLDGDPGHFLVKNATFRALFANLIDTGWGVIDTSLLHDDFNLPAATISHVTEFDGGGLHVDPCEDCTPSDPRDPPNGHVPAPGTLLLLLAGLAGVVWGNGNRRAGTRT